MVQFDFERVKEKVLATAGRAADKSVEFCKRSAEKAKILGRITKLRTEIAMEKDALHKSFVELGKLYYEQNRDKPAAGLAQAVTEVGVSADAVARKEAEVKALKKVLADDYDEIVEDVKEKTEDAKEKAEAAAEDIKEKVKDAAEDLKEKVEEKIEDAKPKTRKKPGPKPKPKQEAKPRKKPGPKPKPKQEQAQEQEQEPKQDQE